MQNIIDRLRKWSEPHHHNDRVLSDEIMLAIGWKVEQSSDYEGGIRWYIGCNPEMSVSEKNRPHYLYSVDCALSLIPRSYSVEIHLMGALTHIKVWKDGFLCGEENSLHNPCIAICIAALKTQQVMSGLRAVKTSPEVRSEGKGVSCSPLN